MPPSPSPVSSMSLSATTSRSMPPPVLPSRRASVVASASSASSSGEDVEKEAKKAAKEAKKLAKEAKKAQKVRREKEEIEKTLTLGWLLSPKLFAADSLSHLETPKTAHTHAPPGPRWPPLKGDVPGNFKIFLGLPTIGWLSASFRLDFGLIWLLAVIY